MAEFIINSSDELTSRIHFALTNGIVMAYGDEDVAVLPAPFSLHPFKYPTTAFETGVQMAPIFNRLGKPMQQVLTGLFLTVEIYHQSMRLQMIRSGFSKHWKL